MQQPRHVLWLSDTSDTITVPDADSITDIDVYLDISHTWVGDLIIDLTHTNTGSSVTLMSIPGGGVFGCGGDDILATINDEGADGNANEQCSNLPAIGGDLVGGAPPNTSLLATFDGESTAGDWVLDIDDTFSSFDDGTLNEWCVVFTTN